MKMNSCAAFLLLQHLATKSLLDLGKCAGGIWSALPTRKDEALFRGIQRLLDGGDHPGNEIRNKFIL